MDASDIEQLVTRVGLGDRAAFFELYRATSAKLFGICLRVLKNRTDAEDVLQEVYIKVWNHSGSYQVSGYSPMTWLITIARNQSIDRLRLRRPDASELSEAESVADSAPTPEQAALRVGEADRLRHCLDQLAPASPQRSPAECQGRPQFRARCARPLEAAARPRRALRDAAETRLWRRVVRFVSTHHRYRSQHVAGHERGSSLAA